MPDLVLEILKYAFLAVLYIFIARAIRAVHVELKGETIAPPRARSAAPAPARAPARRGKKSPTKAVVVEGPKKGKAFQIADELIIGRGEKCHLVLDDDAYVSQVHARIFTRDGTCMVEDLGSTNGTYINRRRITAPSEGQRGDRIKIGKTVLELRK